MSYRYDQRAHWQVILADLRLGLSAIVVKNSTCRMIQPCTYIIYWRWHHTIANNCHHFISCHGCAYYEYSKINILSVVCLLVSSSTRAAYESAGCSDEGCGIPCYMRPAADSCHYKPFSPCSNEGYDIDLENVILNLNSSLHRLENKLAYLQHADRMFKIA